MAHGAGLHAKDPDRIVERVGAGTAQRSPRARNWRWRMTTNGLAEPLGFTSDLGKILSVSECCHTCSVRKAGLAHALLAPYGEEAFVDPSVRRDRSLV
jgi:hypothetical protein